MPRWTEEAKRKQAEKIQSWRPWTTAGVKTPEGKAISCMNALKHGYRTAEKREQLQTLKRHIRSCFKDIDRMDAVMEKLRRRFEHKPKKMTI